MQINKNSFTLECLLSHGFMLYFADFLNKIAAMKCSQSFYLSYIYHAITNILTFFQN